MVLSLQQLSEQQAIVSGYLENFTFLVHGLQEGHLSPRYDGTVDLVKNPHAVAERATLT